MNKQQTKKKKLKNFKVSIKRGAWMNQVQDQLPQFLQNNLQDEARSIKMLDQSFRSYIRIFILQLLKHCIETQDLEQSTSTLNKFMDMVEKNVEKLWLPEKYSQYGFQQKELKELLFQFLEVCSETRQSLDILLSKYPIAEDILTCFFQVFIQQQCGQETETQATKILKILCELFLIDYAQYDECFQFIITENYVYLDDPEHVYLIYIDEEKAKIARQQAMKKSQQFAQYNKLGNSGKRYSQQKISFAVNNVITFDQSEIVFDEIGTQTKSFKQSQKSQDTSKSQKAGVKTNDTMAKTQEEADQPLSALSSPKNQTYRKQYTQSNHRALIDISSQFTNSIVLQYVREPYRKTVQDLKTKARNQRRERQGIKPLFG